VRPAILIIGGAARVMARKRFYESAGSRAAREEKEPRRERNSAL